MKDPLKQYADSNGLRFTDVDPSAGSGSLDNYLNSKGLTLVDLEGEDDEDQQGLEERGGTIGFGVSQASMSLGGGLWKLAEYAASGPAVLSEIMGMPDDLNPALRFEKYARDVSSRASDITATRTTVGEALSGGLNVTASRQAPERWSAGDWKEKLGAGLFSVGTIVGGAGAAGRLGTGASFLSRSSAVAGGYSAATTAPQAEQGLAEQIKKKHPTLSDEEAIQMARSKAGATALASGLITATITRFVNPFGTAGVEAGMPTREALAAAIRDGAVKAVGRSALSEAIEEGADELAQSVLEYSTFNPDLTKEEALANAFQASVIGGVLGGKIEAARRVISNAGKSGSKETADALAKEVAEKIRIEQQVLTDPDLSAEAGVEQDANDLAERARKLEQQAEKAEQDGLPELAKSNREQVVALREQAEQAAKPKPSEPVPLTRVSPDGTTQAVTSVTQKGGSETAKPETGILNANRRYRQDLSEQQQQEVKQTADMVAQKITEDKAQKESDGWAEVEEQLQSNVSPAIVEEAKSAGVDPAKIRRTKRTNKITNRALKDAISDKKLNDKIKEDGQALAEAAAKRDSDITADTGAADLTTPDQEAASPTPEGMESGSVTDFEGDGGRVFELTQLKNGKVTVKVKGSDSNIGIYSREAAEKLITSGSLDYEHDLIKGNEAVVEAAASTPQLAPAAPEATAPEATAKSEPEDFTGQENRVLMPEQKVVIVVEAGLDPFSKETENAIQLAMEAYVDGAANLGYKGNIKSPIEIVITKGWSASEGGPMMTKPALNQNAIYVGVDNINSWADGNLDSVASEEIWHLVEAQGLLNAYLKDNPDKGLGGFGAYYQQHYNDIFDGMTAKEIREVLSVYFPKGDPRRLTMDDVDGMREKGGDSYDRLRLVVASEYTRMRGQQILENRFTEAGYSNREIAPAMNTFLRKVMDYVAKLIDSGIIIEITTSTPAARRINETRAILNELSELDNVKKAEAEAKAQLEARQDSDGDTTLRSAPAGNPDLPRKPFWLGPKGEIIEISHMDAETHAREIQAHLESKSKEDYRRFREEVDKTIKESLDDPTDPLQSEDDAYIESPSAGGGFRLEAAPKYLIEAANKMKWLRVAEVGSDYMMIEGQPTPAQDKLLKNNAIWNDLAVLMERPSDGRSMVYKGMDYAEGTVIRSGAGSLPTNSAFWMVKDGSFIDMKEKGATHVPSLMKYLAGKSKAMVEELKKLTKAEAQKEVDDPDEPATTLRQTMMPVGKGRKMDFSDEHYIAAANRMGFVRVVRFNNQIQIEGSPNRKQLAQLEDDAFERGVDVTDQTTGRTIIRGSEGRGDRGMAEDSRFTAWSAVSGDVKIKRIQDASKVLNTPAASFSIRKAIEQPRRDLTNEQVTTVINSLRLYHGTDLMTSQMIREQGFMSGSMGKVGGGIYFAPDRDTNVFGSRSQPAEFARDKGDGEIMEIIADFSLILNGDQLAADDTGELTQDARAVLEAVADIGGLNGFDGTPEEIFEDILRIERHENSNDQQVNMSLWEMMGRLSENFTRDPFIPDNIKPSKDTLSTDHDLKIRLKEKGYEGITFYSGYISDGKNVNPMAGREVVAFRSVEEHLTRNYIRKNLFEEVDGKQEVRSGVSDGMINNNGESPVAPIPHEKSVLGTMKRVLSPHRWAIGGEDLLRRAGLNDLADSLREYYDAESIMMGRFFDGYRERQERYTYEEWETAKDEFNRYMTVRERGPKEDGDGQKFREQAEAMLEGMSPATKDLIAWQKSIATQTGMLSEELNVHVYDPSMQKGKGGWRPIGNLGEWHFPRMFKQETFDIITNRNLPEFKDKYRTLLNDMVANGNAETVEEAHESLQQNYKDTTGGDYFANLERARGTKLPDQYYDNSVDAYLHFIRRYSERTAQIQAFGQSMDGRVKDAWDVAKAEVGDQQLADDIDLIQKTVYRQRPKWEGWQNVASWGTGISSMLYLSGPLTSMRNLTSALRMNMESFGFLNTAGALGKSLLQSIKATAITAQKITAGEWTAKFWKEGAKTATPEMVAEAHAMGALRMDFQTAQLLDLYEDSPWYDSKSAKAMLVKGNTMALWMHGATERMGRSISYAAGLQWLRATRTLVKDERGDYKRRLALMKRLGFHTEADRQAVLSGDPVEVQRFLRATVREKQYSYDISQSPLFFASPVGRMFFQFQKWGYQRLRDLGRNVISPALGGDKVYYKGKELQVERDFKPLLRMAILSMGAGELYAFLRSLLTDRERKEAGFGEIAETYNVDEQRGMALAFERIANNFVLDGGSGIIGDYYQLSKDMATRGWRYKNPLEPPTIQTGKEIVGLVTDRFTRESLTEGMGRDLKDFFMRLPVLRQPPLSTMVDGVMDNTVDDDWSSRKDAMNQVGNLRNAARRFADEYELDEERSMNFIMDAKNPNSYLYDSIHDALLVGDFERARELRKEAIEKASPKDRKKKLLAIKTSVRNRQPLKVGGVENEKVRTAFYKWLKERRPDEAANLMQVQRRYLVTAARAGLR